MREPMSDERLKEFRQMESGDRLTGEEVELLAEVDRLRDEVVEAWDMGYQAGYEEAAFDYRGSPSDSDAHTFPRTNPYRKEQADG